MLNRQTLRDRLDSMRNGNRNSNGPDRTLGSPPAVTFNPGSAGSYRQAFSSIPGMGDSNPRAGTSPGQQAVQSRLGWVNPRANDSGPGVESVSSRLPQPSNTTSLPGVQGPQGSGPYGPGGSPGAQAQGPQGTSPYGRPLTGPVPPDQWNTLLANNQAIAQQITDIFMLKYGMIPGGQQTLVSLVNKAVNEGYPMQAIQQMIDQGYNQDDVFREASDAVQLEYGPQEAAIRRAIEEINRQSNRDSGIARGTGDRTSAMIQQIYERLNNTQGELAGSIAGAYQRGNEGSQEGYEAARSALQAFMTEGSGQLAAGAQNSGSEAAMGAIQDRIQQHAAPGAQEMASNQASSAALLNTLGANNESNMHRLTGASALQGANEQTGALTRAQAIIGEILNQRTGAINEQQGLLSDIYANRGSAMRNAIDEIKQRNLDRERQTGQDALNERLVESQIRATDSGIGQNQQRLDNETTRMVHDMSMDIQRFGLDERQVSAQIGLINAQIVASGVSNDVARAQIQQIMSDIGLTEAQQQLIMAQISQTQADTDQTTAITDNIRNPLVNQDGTPVAPPEGAEGEDPFTAGTQTELAHNYLTENNVPIINLSTANTLITHTMTVLGVAAQISQLMNPDLGIDPIVREAQLTQLRNSVPESLRRFIDIATSTGDPLAVARAMALGSEAVRSGADGRSPQHVMALIEILLGGGSA